MIMDKNPQEAEKHEAKPVEKKPEAKPAEMSSKEVPPEVEKKPQPKPVQKPPEKPKPSFPGVKLFNRWDTSQVKVEDTGLRGYINLRPIIVPRSGGKYAPVPFHKGEMSIVERLMNKLSVPGHKGKKHRLTSGHCPGRRATLYKDMKEALEIIEKKENQNPVQLLVKALENSSMLEEVASYRMGGTIARKSVLVSPQRRLDIALKHLAQGIFKASFKSKSSLAQVIAKEVIAAANNDPKSFPIMERNRIEKEAEGAR